MRSSTQRLRKSFPPTFRPWCTHDSSLGISNRSRTCKSSSKFFHSKIPPRRDIVLSCDQCQFCRILILDQICQPSPTRRFPWSDHYCPLNLIHRLQIILSFSAINLGKRLQHPLHSALITLTNSF